MRLNAFFWNFVFCGVKEITCSSTMCNVGVPPERNMIGTSDCREISFSRIQFFADPKIFPWAKRARYFAKNTQRCVGLGLVGSLCCLPKTDPGDILKVPDSAFENG